MAFHAEEEAYDPLEQAELLQNMLLAHATGETSDAHEYTQVRTRLMADETVHPYLPRFVKSCRDLGQFWGFIKAKYPTYAERREFIWSEFRPLLDKLEGMIPTPLDVQVTDALGKLDIEHVQQAWERTLTRRMSDPEGAITSARTLLESVCKSILDNLGVSYSDKDDLPKLYRSVAEQLNLAPEQHSEDVFKQILGGCQSVVGGLAAVRNRFGDAHGQGKQPVKPAPRHAELAVNLAGSMALFLVQTWGNKV